MGSSASVLSLPTTASIPAAATAIAGAAGCFALGYLLALSRLPRHAAAPASGGLSDEDSEDDSGEDDDENSGCSRTAKQAGRKRTGLRLLFWARNVVTKSGSAREAERAQAQTAAIPLEIENLAEIIEDFKMVLIVRNDLKMGKGKIAAQCRTCAMSKIFCFSQSGRLETSQYILLVRNLWPEGCACNLSCKSKCIVRIYDVFLSVTRVMQLWVCSKNSNREHQNH
ncbi:uncharacterized protein LOC133925129 isoform X2 [Phragmites australis]|uniref:uncharacterized protein LOC133925129 isoform X2 n=1 Tax=Phragmites australis TaxID=29695 RepID=UPI002D769C62|nr:uncharacterized protein LOC133925129 isoform X2 [Phragmites australis]